MGVHLNDSAIDYGEVTSQFQGKPMAYLVANADNAMLRDRVIRQSRLHCATTDPSDMASVVAPSNHGPPPSPTLMTCGRPVGDYNDPASVGEWGGHLTVWFDPQAGDRRAWLTSSPPRSDPAMRLQTWAFRAGRAPRRLGCSCTHTGTSSVDPPHPCPCHRSPAPLILGFWRPEVVDPDWGMMRLKRRQGHRSTAELEPSTGRSRHRQGDCL